MPAELVKFTLPEERIPTHWVNLPSGWRPGCAASAALGVTPPWVETPGRRVVSGGGRPRRASSLTAPRGRPPPRRARSAALRGCRRGRSGLSAASP